MLWSRAIPHMQCTLRCHSPRLSGAQTLWAVQTIVLCFGRTMVLAGFMLMLLNSLFIKAKVGVNTTAQDWVIRLSGQGLNADFQGHVVRNVGDRKHVFNRSLGEMPLQVCISSADPRAQQRSTESEDCGSRPPAHRLYTASHWCAHPGL